MEYLELIVQMQNSDQHLAQNGLASQIASVIQTNIDDASGDVRKAARRGIFALETLFPEMARTIKDGLSKSMMRLLEKERFGYAQRVPSVKRSKTAAYTTRRFKKAKMSNPREAKSDKPWKKHRLKDERPQSAAVNWGRARSKPLTSEQSSRASLKLMPMFSKSPPQQPENSISGWSQTYTQLFKNKLESKSSSQNLVKSRIASQYRRTPATPTESVDNCELLSWRDEGASLADVSRVLAQARGAEDYSTLVPYDRDLRVKLEKMLQKISPEENKDFKRLFCAVCDFIFGIQCSPKVLTSLVSTCIIKLGYEAQREHRPKLLKRLHNSFTVLHSYETGAVLHEIISKMDNPILDEMCIDFAQMALDSLKSSKTRLTQIEIKNYNVFIKKLLWRLAPELTPQITRLVRTMNEHVLPYQRTALGSEITGTCSKLEIPDQVPSTASVSPEKAKAEVRNLSRNFDHLFTPGKDGSDQPKLLSGYCISRSMTASPERSTINQKQYTYIDYANFISPFSKPPGPPVHIDDLLKQLENPDIPEITKLQSIRILSDRAGKRILENNPEVLNHILVTITRLVSSEKLLRNVLRIAKRLAINYNTFANEHIIELLQLVTDAFKMQGQELLSLDAAEHLSLHLDPSIAVPWLITQLEETSGPSNHRTNGIFTLLDQFLVRWNSESLRMKVERLYTACSNILLDLSRDLDRSRAMRLLIKVYIALGNDSSWITNKHTRNIVINMAQKPQFVAVYTGVQNLINRPEKTSKQLKHIQAM